MRWFCIGSCLSRSHRGMLGLSGYGCSNGRRFLTPLVTVSVAVQILLSGARKGCQMQSDAGDRAAICARAPAIINLDSADGSGVLMADSCRGHPSLF